MTEFWESSFRDKHTMWGNEPAEAAVSTMALFAKNGLKEILIPGFGYGRNAKPFIDHGFNVTGIEISATAIDLAKKQYGDDLSVYHGSVCDMPFDEKQYDGIFCYALIHLLDEKERAKLIKDCYHQLRPGGYMVFVAVSHNTPTFGEGTPVSKDRFETKHGIKLYFYNTEAVKNEFGHYGLLETTEIREPVIIKNDKPHLVFWQITCKKE